MAKLKILAYSIYYWPELASTAQIYTELFEGLSEDFDITVICAVPCYTGEVPEEYLDNRTYVEGHGGVVIVRVPVRPYDKRNKKQRIINIVDFWMGARKVTKELVSTENYDLIFTYSQPPILGGMLGVYASSLTKAPLIYGIQDFNPEQTMAVGYAGNAALHKVMMTLDKRSCRLSKCVIVPGRDLVETLERRFSGKQVPYHKVINNWTDNETIVPLPKDDPRVALWRKEHGLEGKFVIMYSGNIGLYYDLRNLFKVLEHFKHYDDVAFAFVGEGAVKSDLEDYAKSHLMNNVVFIPYQPKDLLPISLNAADVHLVTNARGIKGVSCPSKAYGIMATGVPMIAVLEPGSEVWKLVEESGCGITVEAGDYVSFDCELKKILRNKSEWVSQQRSGREFLDNNLTKQLAIEKYRKLFRDLAMDK